MVVLRVVLVAVSVEVGLILGPQDALEGGQLADLLCAEVCRFVQHEAVAVAQDVCREPSVQTEASRADDGGESALYKRLSSLEVLSGYGHFGLFGHFPHGWYVHCGVGGSHDEGGSFGQCCVGIAHGGSHVLAVVCLHGGLEVGKAVVYVFVHGYVYLRRGGPDDDDAAHATFLSEAADVFAQGFHHFPSGAAALDVVAVKAGGIVFVEGGLHGNDLLQFVGHGFDVAVAKHLGVQCAFVGVGGIDVPGGKHEVVKTCQGDNVAIVQVLLLFATSHADFVVLCHGADWLCQSLACHHHARDECRGDGSESHAHDTQFSFSGFHYFTFVLMCFFIDVRGSVKI